MPSKNSRAEAEKLIERVEKIKVEKIKAEERRKTLLEGCAEYGSTVKELEAELLKREKKKEKLESQLEKLIEGIREDVRKFESI